MTDPASLKIKLRTSDGLTDTMFMPAIPSAGEAVVFDRTRYRVSDEPRTFSAAGVGSVVAWFIVVPAVVEARNIRGDDVIA